MKSNKCNLDETFNSDKSFYDNESADESNVDKYKVTEEKNGIHEKGLFKNHRVKVNNFPGGTSVTILENIDQLVKSKQGSLIIDAETNDVTY